MEIRGVVRPPRDVKEIGAKACSFGLRGRLPRSDFTSSRLFFCCYPDRRLWARAGRSHSLASAGFFLAARLSVDTRGSATVHSVHGGDNHTEATATPRVRSLPRRASTGSWSGQAAKRCDRPGGAWGRGSSRDHPRQTSGLPSRLPRKGDSTLVRAEWWRGWGRGAAISGAR